MCLCGADVALQQMGLRGGACLTLTICAAGTARMHSNAKIWAEAGEGLW